MKILLGCYILLTIYIILPFSLFGGSSDACSIESSKNQTCPELLSKIMNGSCDKVNCGSRLEKHMCPPDTIYIHNFSLCGCCPRCVRFRKLDEEFELGAEERVDPKCLDSDDDNHCPVEVNECLPCLVYNQSTRKCDLPPPTFVPHADSEECMYRKSLRRLDLLHWDPDCDDDLSFAPKQCKGTHYSGECFCVDRDGNRIFGREWRIKSENQTCACSRKVSDLRARNLISTLHCSSDGNYEPLQCDSDTGMCYCVDPMTGRLDGSALPQNQWKQLPCYYNLNLTDGHEDGQYLRKCESTYAAAKALQIVGKAHGIRLELRRYVCDFDGSYAPVQTFGTTSECVFKNGTRIKDNFKPATVSMDCNCVRDKEEYFPSQNKSSSLDCEMGTGNYDVAYDFGSYSSCVDRDGFMYGDLVKSTQICCLLSEGCSTTTQQLCYNNVTNLDGLKPCAFWPYRI